MSSEALPQAVPGRSKTDLTEPSSGPDRSGRLDIGCERAPEVQLNLNVRGLAPSATVAINERSDELRRQGRTIYKLGLGQSPFPVPAPVVEELQRNAFQKDYLPVKGLPALRQTVAEHHYRNFGIEGNAEDVLVGPGSKELMFLLQLVYYGELVIPTPTWVSYAPQAQILGRRVQFLPTTAEGGWRLSPQQLDALCRADPGRPRIVILNYPSNPTGTTYALDELQQLAEVARRYRLILLSDEIYGKLHHDGRHESIVPFYPEGTIFSGGLSKWCGAGGWRLGIFVFPACLRWLQNAMAAVASETFTSTSAPIQYAAVSAFQESAEIDAYLRQSRRILGALGRRLAARLEQAGARVVVPQGGFYLFPDFGPLAERLRARGITTSSGLCEQLLEDTGVAILPGHDFGRPPEELTARLAYVNFHGGRALEAAETAPGHRALDEEFLQSCCGDTLTAVDRLCEWLEE
jgi:aspartate aminotransferase